MRVGIVGGGAMGSWLKREMTSLHEVRIFDVDKSRSDVGSLEELALWAEALIVAVPFWETSGVLKALAPLSRGRLVMDIATFKEGVVETYGLFPQDALVATVHPLFGPGASSIRGQRVLIMAVPGRRGAEEAFRFWSELGARAEWGELEKHDFYVSRTIALSYAVGLALARLYGELGDEVFKYGGTSFKYLATYAFSLLRDPNAAKYAEKAPIDEFIGFLKREDAPKALIDPDAAYRAFYKALEAMGEIQR
ncbi:MULTISPECIES: prephenate dehydrogenase [Pyrobaculum]|nr:MULTISPECIES: prephenate dehydrogenase [Pyrobaculum]MCX8136896.1 prephenate dehydrogenase [Pyrobaculum aerophilum]MCY0891049.1 prephenate dehydrogenase [Pyrobaculum arsenaticum]NYR16460.1 prephenate dehydrogenase [Pyrobaculum arsenaticum]HII46955.1 prephenate dehydrogenase [Pyrobaculum aerophilum]